VQADYISTVQASLAFSIPLSVINFTLVPPPLRIAFLDATDCVWSTVLSYFSHRSVTTPADAHAEADAG
jgi:hypothetical protein